MPIPGVELLIPRAYTDGPPLAGGVELAVLRLELVPWQPLPAQAPNPAALWPELHSRELQSIKPAIVHGPQLSSLLQAVDGSKGRNQIQIALRALHRPDLGDHVHDRPAPVKERMDLILCEADLEGANQDLIPLLCTSRVFRLGLPSLCALCALGRLRALALLALRLRAGVRGLPVIQGITLGVTDHGGKTWHNYGRCNMSRRHP